MSQRGSAARPASYPSSRSPVKYDEISPRQQPAQHGKHDSQNESSGTTAMGGHGSVPASSAAKSLGMYSLLNPTERNGLASGIPGQPPRPVETEYSSVHARGYGGSESASTSLPTTPAAGGSGPAHLGRPALSERNSPSTTFPFPPVNQRKILSPRLQHIAAYKEAISPHESDPRPHTGHPGAVGVKRPFGSDGHAGGYQQPQGIHHPPASGPSPPRAYSQSGQRPDGRHGGPIAALPSTDYHRRAEGSGQYPPSVQFQLGNHPPHGPPPAGGGPPWSDMLRRTGLGGSVMGGEGQQAFMTLPGSETPIAVQVDYSQASKKADEKRQRNAKASTRHRRKKKTIQEENVRQIQEMADEKDDLVERVEELTRQRDFYRDERNRLRDIVLRTPSIAQHASGPPSPTSTRSVTSYQERSPIAQSRHVPTPSQGYLSEASSVERPAQRRRTEERPEYGVNYSTQPGPPPSTLPPMHGHGQGMPPRPASAASFVPLERLPPLRSIEGHPPADVASGQPHERDPVTGDWRPAQPRPYETGWATPRHPGDGGQPR